MVTIKTAEFITSSSDVGLCPKTNLPEFAFIGRSNVGKSSLINMLTGRTKLAMTSMKPGKTILINHFFINKQWYLVDLPGYGFAKRSHKMQDKFQHMIRQYILLRPNLYNLFVLVDGNIPPQAIDLDFINWLGNSQIAFSIIFTKCDKSSAGSYTKNVKTYLEKLSETWEELPSYFVVSSIKKIGREEILEYITSIIAQAPNTNNN